MNFDNPNGSAHNADATELGKFSDLAHHWWDVGGPCRPLHQINPLRLGWVNRCCPVSGRSILDVGCGGGILTESLVGAGATATGIDLSAKALAVARLHALESSIRADSLQYLETSAEALADRQPASFDVVTCMEMLEHVPDPSSVVQACATLVRPGGWVFFSTINRNPKSFLLAIVGAEYLFGLLPRGTHDYHRLIRPSELAGFCRRAGLSVLHTCGLSYNPLTQRCWLGSDVSVNYLLAAQKLTGPGAP